MKVNGSSLNNFQANFLKELMGDVFMTDVRAEAIFNKVCLKYKIKVDEVLEVINKDFAVRNAEFKKEIETQGA